MNWRIYGGDICFKPKAYYTLKEGFDYVRFVLTDGGNIMIYRKEGSRRESVCAKKRI